MALMFNFLRVIMILWIYKKKSYKEETGNRRLLRKKEEHTMIKTEMDP